MKNFILLVALFLSLNTLAEISSVQTPEGVPYKNHIGTKSSKFVIEKDNKSVDFVKIVNHNLNPSQIDALKIYLPAMNTTLSSQCFGDFILSRDLIQTNGKSNKEVLEHIRSSRVGIELVSYWSFKSTVGYTYPNVDKVWMNKRLHDNFTPCRSASNLAHEASHKIGYGHDYRRTQRRPYSVPYSINAGFTKCCKDPKIGVEKVQVQVCYRSWKTLWLKKTCYWKEVK